MEMTGKWTQIVRQQNIEQVDNDNNPRLANLTKMLKEKRKQESVIIESDYDEQEDK